MYGGGGWRHYIREAAKKFFSRPTTKALTEHSGHTFFREFLQVKNKLFFLSGPGLV